MKETNEDNKNIVSLIKEYISTRIELAKLTAFERLSIALANLITSGFIFICVALTVLFGSVSLGFYLGNKLDSNAKGFSIVALIYLLFGLIMYFIKDRLVEKSLIDFLVKKMFRNKK
jgi:hypothetical protein